jgi:hypothetical protein
VCGVCVCVCVLCVCVCVCVQRMKNNTHTHVATKLRLSDAMTRFGHASTHTCGFAKARRDHRTHGRVNIIACATRF